MPPKLYVPNWNDHGTMCHT